MHQRDRLESRLIVIITAIYIIAVVITLGLLWPI
jgi:hypothetical protein